MQFKILAVSALVSLVAAQDVTSILAQIPSCATTCLAQGASTIGCGLTDYACQCGKTTELATAVTPCLTGACSTADLLTVQKLSGQLCALVGGASASAAVSSVIATATSAASSAVSAATTTAMATSNGTITTGSPSATSSSPAVTKNAAVGKAEAGMGLFGAIALAALAL